MPDPMNMVDVLSDDLVKLVLARVKIRASLEVNSVGDVHLQFTLHDTQSRADGSTTVPMHIGNLQFNLNEIAPVGYRCYQVSSY